MNVMSNQAARKVAQFSHMFNVLLVKSKKNVINSGHQTSPGYDIKHFIS
jgi:hypothetical protein